MPCSRNGHLPPYSTQHSNSSDPHSYTSSPHKPLAFYFLFFFSTTVLYTFVKCNRKFFCQPVLFISPYSWSYSGCICSFSLASPLLDSFSYFYILRYFSLVAVDCREESQRIHCSGIIQTQTIRVLVRGTMYICLSGGAR